MESFVVPLNQEYILSVAAYSFGMTTPSNKNIFRVTGPLCENSPVNFLAKAGDMELWCFLWSAREQTVGLAMVSRMIWYAFMLIMTSL